MKCERCKSETSGYNLFDYCAVCSSNLCPRCMADGCCGNVPAKSGMEADNGESFSEQPDFGSCSSCGEEVQFGKMEEHTCPDEKGK